MYRIIAFFLISAASLSWWYFSSNKAPLPLTNNSHQSQPQPSTAVTNTETRNIAESELPEKNIAHPDEKTKKPIVPPPQSKLQKLDISSLENWDLLIDTHAIKTSNLIKSTPVIDTFAGYSIIENIHSARPPHEVPSLKYFSPGDRLVLFNSTNQQYGLLTGGIKLQTDRFEELEQLIEKYQLTVVFKTQSSGIYVLEPSSTINLEELFAEFARQPSIKIMKPEVFEAVRAK